MLSKVTFGSFLVYAPRGTNEVSKRAKQFVRALKEERPIGIGGESPSEYAARRIAEEIGKGVLADFFVSTPNLIPVPRSSLTIDGGIWPSLNIASALVKHSIGARVLPCLERVKPVPKSAFSATGTRPKPHDHYESIAVKRMVVGNEPLCLVDDVITKGATILGAAARLAEAYPAAEIFAFSLVRTMGFVDNISEMIDAVIGTITLRGDDALREP